MHAGGGGDERGDEECDAMTIEVACSLRSRLRGLLGRGDYPGVLLLVPCNDVHTFGMRHDIDVAFISAEGVVLESHRGMAPCRRRRCRGASATLERISSEAAWFERGDRVELNRLVQEARVRAANGR